VTIVIGEWLDAVAGEDYCYVTTTGRRTGRPHTIEIWFGVHDGAIYLLSGNRDRSDWVRNLTQNATVQVRIGRETRTGQARVVDPQAEAALDATARRLLAAKYQGWREGRPLSTWARTALAVEIRFPSYSTTRAGRALTGVQQGPQPETGAVDSR
jgi:deazaflavin-dependent oxidoreductase (nitroreductase family)